MQSRLDDAIRTLCVNTTDVMGTIIRITLSK
jgi:hypothetical protein